MAYKVKLFVEIADLISNTNDVIAVAGEMGPNSKAFTPDLKVYSDHATHPGYTANVLSSKQNDADVACPQEVIDRSLDMVKNLYNSYTGGDAVGFLGTIYSDLLDVSVEADVSTGGKTLVEQVKATMQVNSEAAVMEIYIADAFLTLNYDEAIVKVVPPLNPVTQLIDTFDNVSARITSRSTVEKFELEETIRASQPNSHRRSYTLRWVDPTNTANVVNTEWTILGYGPKSMQTDFILEAVREYLLANSSLTIDQWKEYLPDLTVEDNFTFIPFWDNVALSAGPGIDSYYRPIIKMQTAAAVGNANFTRRTVEEFTELGEIVSTIFRNLQMIAVPGLGNSDNELSFANIFDDYTLIPSTNADYLNISSLTRNALEGLERLVILCEAWTAITVLPGDITVENIDGRNFLVTSVDGILYKVLVSSDFSRT